MAPPRAAKNFQQRQPITTTLRTICQSYPSNTCLRELLQNADDAGATEIEYVLNTRQYTDEPLLHTTLSEYQGPALLARNNSVFTDKDFSSLSSVGDSGKRDDPASTGKFGQGFNSVYHWTDGPWIYSRNWLLILDPHQGWSNETDKPGGPAWNVFENDDCLEVKNTLKTLDCFNIDLEKESPETIIRIPLRDGPQAAASKIAQKEITTQDIEEALRIFAQELRNGGLLFLKHICAVKIRIDDKIISTVQIVIDDSADLRTRQRLPIDFRRLYVQGIDEQISRSFEMKIKHSDESSSWTDRYLLQHTMCRSCGDQELDAWARELKLFPWVGVAAPLDVSSCHGTFAGRLFSTLRLPLLTDQPVHMHGLFAIAPDRARLGFEELAIKWNNSIFKNHLAQAWAHLLLHRTPASCQIEGFAFWPRADLAYTSPWTQMDGWVVDTIIKQNMPVWNTMDGHCVKLDQGLLAENNSQSLTYDQALAKVHLPVVVVSEALLKKILDRAACCAQTVNMRTPAAVRSYFRNTGLVDLTPEVATIILEFCLLDLTSGLKGLAGTKLYLELSNIAIWPTLKGTLVAPRRGDVLMLPRSDSEMALFGKTKPAATLNLNLMTTSVRDLLWTNAVHMSEILRVRTLLDLSTDWPIIYPLTKGVEAPNEMVRPPASDPLLHDIWAWICERLSEENGILPSCIDDLLLLPISDSRIRRLFPGEGSPPTMISEKNEPLAEIIEHLSSRTTLPPMLDNKVLESRTIQTLRKQTRSNINLRLACQDHLESLVEWLAAGKEALRFMTPLQREALVRHIASLIRGQGLSIQPSSEVIYHIKKLPLFKRITSVAPFKERLLTLSSIDQSNRSYEAPHDLPFLPDIEDLSLYDNSFSSDMYLASSLGLLKTISKEELLTNHLLPWFVKTQDKSFKTVKECLVEWIFKDPTFTNTWITGVMSQPIIPLPLIQRIRSYRCIPDLVDPASTTAKLYFETENRFPCPEFYSRRKQALISCGLGDGITWSTPQERAKYYAQCGADIQDIRSKVECLLKLPIEAQLKASEEHIHSIRTLNWLPGKSRLGKSALLAPADCRGADDSGLVDHVLGTTMYTVNEDWKKLLGWDQKVAKDTLLLQLDHCIKQNEHEKVDKILSHMKIEDSESLCDRPCLLGIHRQYLAPGTVFLPGSKLAMYPLAPFLDEIDSQFATKHAQILTKLKVQSNPSVEDLQKVQQLLTPGVDQSLPESSLGMAINILELGTSLDYDPVHLLIPDTTLRLRRLQDIVQGERSIGSDSLNFNFTHPRLSRYLTSRLGVETSLSRAMRLDVDVEDEDEDEYTPHEKLSTIISDTLGLYPVDTTFSEFLANADDAGASKISWTIDQCLEGSHSSQSLLTGKLDAFQGPALIVYNDEIFSDSDFAGLKNIGEGGKITDATTTGMFGRGAMTMYHFTDLPMIISGKFYLVLDPQQTLLPKNRHFKHKTGIKVSLSTIRRVAKDQLTPFHGLYGYDINTDEYKGTMFRLPFRSPGIKTALRDSPRHVSQLTAQKLLEAYFSTARVSLLFLQNVRSIDCFLRGESQPVWSVLAHRNENTEEDVFKQIIINSSYEGYKPLVDIWRVGLTDIIDCPAHIAKVGKGLTKITECGIATCLDQGQLISTNNQVEIDHHSAHVSAVTTILNHSQWVFCRLPMIAPTRLPISFHASFAITGDRKTILYEDKTDVSTWNHWLLSSCLPDLYLQFLRDLAPKIGVKSFNFWPAKPVAGSLKSLDGVLAQTFWEKLLDSNHLDYMLYPIIDRELPASVCGTNDLRRDKTRPTRKVHRVTSFSNARFDFLPASSSEKLCDLFASLHTSIVRPPQRVRTAIRDSAQHLEIPELDPIFISDLLRQEKGYLQLKRFLAQLDDDAKRKGAMASLLEVLVPVVDGKDLTPLGILDGCSILPRPSLNASLGTLIFNPQPDSQWYLLATTEEQSLFYFATDFMVNTTLYSQEGVTKWPSSQFTKGRRDPIAEIANAAFNIRKIEVEDIGNLLARFPTGTPQEFDEWIPQFWQYFDNRVVFGESTTDPANNISVATVDDLLQRANLPDKLIYRYRAMGSWQYITPSQFNSEPYIVHPVSKEERLLCSMIPQLKCIDLECMPLLLRTAEESLERSAGFVRFNSALKKIGTQLSLDATLDSAAKDLLRELLIRYLGGVSKTDPIFDRAVLKNLPVWPQVKRQSHSSLSKHLCAADARFCTHSTMFLPWVRDLTQFVDPTIAADHQESLRMLDIKLMTAEQLWHYIKADLPTSVQGKDPLIQYFNLMSYLATHNIQVSGNIAPNGSGLLCRPDTLYDYDDHIFQAAFYLEQPSHFLHEKMRAAPLRKFWLNAGLRARPASEVMESGDYLQCALAVDQQAESVEASSVYHQNAVIVSTYLLYEKADFSRWPQALWSQVAKVRMFRVKDDLSDQPAFRQARMAQIANNNGYCTLEQAGMIQYIAISWSQMLFLSQEPAAFRYARALDGGEPSTMLVYQHLKFLISTIQDVSPYDLTDFLKDVQASYSHLQEDIETAILLPGIREAKLWLNIDTAQTDSVSIADIQSSLTCATLLCLNSPVDPLPIRCARKFLVPYEKLLKGLGCDAVVQPQSKPRTKATASTEFPLSESMSIIRKLREQSLLTDVIFRVQDRDKSVHKIFLVAVSKFCEKQFLGEWGRTLERDPIITVKGISFSALSAMIDFAYTGEFVAPVVNDPTDRDEIANALDEVLDLLDSTDMWLLTRLHDLAQDFLLTPGVSEKYISVDNVSGVKKRAEESGATRVVSHCEELIRLNSQIVSSLEKMDPE